MNSAFEDKPYRGIAITEGKFKALHLSYLGYRVLNIHGIGNWAKVMPVLQTIASRGEKVFLVFDADSQENLSVAEHAVAAGSALLEAGYEAYYFAWPKMYGKGIDDIIIAKPAQRVRVVPA